MRQTSNSHGKFRPDWFEGEESCFRNLLKVISDDPNVKLTVLFDGSDGSGLSSDGADHFVYKIPGPHKIVNISDGGTEPKSFKSLLSYVTTQDDIKDEDIVYLVEDDYYHIPGAIGILRSVFDLSNADYATLYDHPDKYLPGYYDRFAAGFVPQLFHTGICHWRTTPSTTNTYAMRFKTLKDDLDIHVKWSSTGTKVSEDHKKFLDLAQTKSRILVSPIPGFSTHVENGMFSPAVDWQKVVKSTVHSENSVAQCS